MIQEKKIFKQRDHLLLNLLSPWRRRGAKLLQIGPVCSLSPEFLWDAGFDVGAIVRSQNELDKAIAEIGPKVDFYQESSPPFSLADNSFDYVVLAHTGLTEAELLREAHRLAFLGVIVLDWNWLHPQVRKNPVCTPHIKPWKFHSAIKRELPGYKRSLRSSLAIWPNIGRKREDIFNPNQEEILPPVTFADLIIPLPLGVAIGLRLDFNPAAITPVGRLREATPIQKTGGLPVSGFIDPNKG